MIPANASGLEIAWTLLGLAGVILNGWLLWRARWYARALDARSTVTATSKATMVALIRYRFGKALLLGGCHLIFVAIGVLAMTIPTRPDATGGTWERDVLLATTIGLMAVEVLLVILALAQSSLDLYLERRQ